LSFQRGILGTRLETAGFFLFYVSLMIASGQKNFPEFPPVESLPEIAGMPDPFLRADGRQVESREEWAAQREYLKKMLGFYLWGSLPPKPLPEEVAVRLIADAEFSAPGLEERGTRSVYEITISHRGKSHAFALSVIRPPGGERRPTLVQNYKTTPEPQPFAGEEAVRRGYAFVQFDRTEIAPDRAGNADRREGVFSLYPGFDFRTIAAWAWVVQPILDVLDRLGVADMDKVVMTGHSRGGQAAVAATILDERIAMVCPSAGSVYADMSFRQRDPAGDNAGDIVAKVKEKFPHWHHPRHLEFAGRQEKLPFDAATWFALVAPRPFLSLNGRDDPLNNNLGVEAGVRAGLEIYRAFGAGRWCRVHFREAGINRFGQSGHVQGPEEFLAIFDFADEYFRRKESGETRCNNFRYDPAQYPLLLDWVPPQGLR
jgi:hypothetical protein